MGENRTRRKQNGVYNRRKEKAYFCVYSIHAIGLAMSNSLNSQGIISIYVKFNKIEGDA